MIRCVKDSGYVAFGVPNFWTGATLKAYLLSLPVINTLPGYKLESENFYASQEITNAFQNALISTKRKVIKSKITYHGNPLFIEAPMSIQNTLGVTLEKISPELKYLSLYMYQIK